jgi:hypothetical protein
MSDPVYLRPSDEEEWRDILGHPHYEASTLGRIRSLDRNVPWRNTTRFIRGRILTGSLNTLGRRQVRVTGGELVQVHRLVALAFMGPCPVGMEVCHNDGNHLNNVVTNLRYDTRSQNQLDRVRHGNHHNASKTHCLRNHLLAGENLRIDPTGRRVCRACKCLQQRGLTHAS